MKKVKYATSTGLALLLILSGPVSPAHAAISIVSSTPYVAAIEGTSIWSGNLPTQIRFSGDYSETLEFPITAILPYSQLSDRATGVEVEFELWSDAGRKISDRSIYSFSWNPVSPNTIVEMRIAKEDVVPNATLLVRTMWTIRTTGLLSRYLQTESKTPVSILSGRPPQSVNLRVSWRGNNQIYTWNASKSSRPIDYYEVSVRFLSQNGLNVKSRNSYTEPQSLVQSKSRKFTLKWSTLKSAMDLSGVGNPSHYWISVTAVSDMGASQESNAFYTRTSNLR